MNQNQMQMQMHTEILNDERFPVNETLTPSIVKVCVVAASAGMLFGYDSTVSGGVMNMASFLEKFFPDFLIRQLLVDQTKISYCLFDDALLQFFTSSFYLAAAVSSLAAGRFSADWGRKATLLFGGFSFLTGTAILSAAINMAMLIIGRLILGFGVGLSTQAATIYLAEMAPPKWRGAFTAAFGFFVGIGVLFAWLINYLVSHYKADWNWRISVSVAAVPAIIMIIGTFFIPDTTVSLVQRGRVSEAWDTLSAVRGAESDLETELADIFGTSEAAAAKTKSKSQFRQVFRREYRPHLVISSLLMVFQQLTGVHVAVFYGPIVFRALGFGVDSATICPLIIISFNIVAVFAACLLVDRVGRRILLTVGGIHMCIAQVVLAWLLATKVGSSENASVSKESAIAIMVWIVLFYVGFGYSWGPLIFLISCEVLPIEVRPAGSGICYAINFITAFVLAQTFIPTLCALKFAALLFYATWMMIMTLFILLFLPETKGIPLDAMEPIWEKHWYWTRFVEDKMGKRRDTSMPTILEY